MESPFIHEDLIMEILSWLSVKSLIRFQCVSNSFQSLISEPMFVKMHLEKSSKNATFLITYIDSILKQARIRSCPHSSLLENSSSSPLHVNHPGLVFNVKNKYKIVATCNGLVCLVSGYNLRKPYKFCLWNPATGQKFKYPHLSLPRSNNCVKTFGFGYDTTTDNYKFVALLSSINYEDGSLKSCKVKVCTVGDTDNGWRSIQDFPGDPITVVKCCGVYLNNSLNWLASSIPIHYNNGWSYCDNLCDNLVIVSLDMGSEKYTRLLLPQALNGVHTNVFSSDLIYVPRVPRIGILNDCLSLFLIDSLTHHFSIWQVKEVENRNSWTRLVHVKVQDIHDMPQPLRMFQNDSVLMIAYRRKLQVIFYNEIDNLVEYTEFPNNIRVHEENYVQSLVSPRRH